MKLTSGNVFHGVVESASPFGAKTELEVRLESGDVIRAVVGASAVAACGITPGKDIAVAVKAAQMILNTDAYHPMEGANNFAGIIDRIARGFSSCKVSMTTGSGLQVHCTLSMDAADQLGLDKGLPVGMLFKPSRCYVFVKK